MRAPLCLKCSVSLEDHESSRTPLPPRKLCDGIIIYYYKLLFYAVECRTTFSRVTCRSRFAIHRHIRDITVLFRICFRYVIFHFSSSLTAVLCLHCQHTDYYCYYRVYTHEYYTSHNTVYTRFYRVVRVLFVRRTPIKPFD